MTAFLPQHDPLRLVRKAELVGARILYRYNYSHVSPLAMVDRVPIKDEFSFAWLKIVAERVMNGLANMAEVEISSHHRDFHLAKLRMFQSLLSSGIAEVAGLRLLVSEALRFDGRIGASVERPQQLEDYARMFHTIGLPAVAKDYDQDRVFAAMRVAGPNPVMIRRMTGRDARFAVTDEHLHTVAPQDSLDAALHDGRLYLVDYQVLDHLPAGDFPHGQKYLYAPLAMFVVDKKSRQLLPVAIQCQQQPAPDNPIFTNLDGSNWLIAKTIVEIADGNVHEAVSHLARTHFMMEPFVVATHRQLALKHPLHVLLLPHFEGTLAINDAAWKQLIADKGAVDKLMGGSIQVSRKLAVQGVQSYAFDDAPLPKTFAARGVDDVKALPNYPYRDDALLYWNAIHRWVADYVAIYYTSDAELAQDAELQAWYTELRAQDGGRVVGLGKDTVLARRDYLIDVLATIIYTCSVQHAAVNFPQYDLMSYVPNMPLAGYTPAPKTKPGGTPADYLAMLPPLDMAELQMNLGYLLGSVHYTSLGQYQTGHFADPRLAAPLAQFQKAVAEIGRVIQTRNQQRRPYEFLLPAGVPQSINI